MATLTRVQRKEARDCWQQWIHHAGIEFPTSPKRNKREEEREGGGVYGERESVRAHAHYKVWGYEINYCSNNLSCL